MKPFTLQQTVEMEPNLDGCLAETRNFSQAMPVLNEIESLLADYAGCEAFNAYFARL
jgi:hypothetical protein